MAAFACKKISDGQKSVQEDAIVIKGSAPSLKTILTRDDTTNYWSSYDDLGIYQIDGGVLKASDKATIDFTSVSLRTASFYPVGLKKLTDWDSKTPEAGMYVFAPCLGELPVPDGYKVELNVPEVQSSEWGRSQILVAEPAALNKVMNFQFRPATALLCLRLNLGPDSNVPTLNVAKIEISFEGASVVGGCCLDIETGVLTSTAPEQTSLSIVFEKPLMVIRTETASVPNEYNSFTYCVLIPSAPTGKIGFRITDIAGNIFTTDAKEAPASGFRAGERYRLDRFFTAVVNSEDDADGSAGSYSDSGNMWDAGEINNDGAYDDAGNMW